MAACLRSRFLAMSWSSALQQRIHIAQCRRDGALFGFGGRGSANHIRSSEMLQRLSALRDVLRMIAERPLICPK